MTRSVRRALPTAIAASAILISSALPSAGQPAWTGVVASAPPGLEATRGTDPRWSSEMRVEGDADGNAFHIWEQTNGSATTYAIRVARFSATTKTWEWDTATELSPDGIDPAVATNSSGDAVAVWTERVTSSSYRLRASRYNSGSASWDLPVTIATAGTVSMPRVALDATGNAVAIWWQRNGSTSQIQAARYTASAATWAAPVDVVTIGNTISIVWPALVVDSSGNATSVWVLPPLAGVRTNPVVQASRWPSADAGWSAAETLASAPSAFIGDVAGDVTGNVLATWVETSNGGVTYAVRWARYSSSGGSWTAPQTFSSQDRSGPALVIDPEGHATAVWARPGSSGTSTLYYSTLPAQGSSWSAPSVVSTGLSQRLGQLAVDGAGVVTATWSESGDDAPLMRGRTRAARYVRGGSWTAPVTLVEAPSIYSGPSSAAVAAESGDVVVLFSDFRSTRWSTSGAEGLSAPLELDLQTYRDYWGVAFSGEPLVVGWAAPPTGLPVTGYRIEAGTTSATDLAIVDIGATTRVASVVPSVPRFGVRVRAMNGATAGPPSNPFFQNVLVCGGLPAPSELSASVSAGVVTLTWNGVAYADYYRLEAGTGPGLANIASVNVGQARSFSAPAPPGTYYIRVRAVDACAAGAPSNEVIVTVAGGVAVPAAPVLHAPVVNGTTVALTWTPGGGGPATGYTLAASTTPGGAPIVTAPFTATGATFTNVPPGTYDVWLTASNAAGTSPPSAVVTVVVG